MKVVRVLVVSALLLGGIAATAPPSPAHDQMCSAGWIPDPGDQDCDGVRTDGNGPADNCPNVRNADQRNTDSGYTPTEPAASDDATAVMVGGDAAGDACDADDDADGIADERDTNGDGSPDALEDNCRTVRNPRQYGEKTTYGGRQSEGGTLLCPAKDGDGDGHNDDMDNCRFIPNPSQQDLDSDGLGDECDGDEDGDGVADGADNCRQLPNSDQQDADGDGAGRICDFDERFPPSQPISTTSGADDRTAPTVRLTTHRRNRLSDLALGLPTAVRCDEACLFAGELRLPVRAARRLGLPRRLATSTGFVDSAGRTFLFWHPRASAIRALRRGARTVRLQMKVRATDEAGNAKSLRRGLRLLASG